MFYTFYLNSLKNSCKSLVVSNKLCIFAAPVPAKPLNDAQMCGSFYFYTLTILFIP